MSTTELTLGRSLRTLSGAAATLLLAQGAAAAATMPPPVVPHYAHIFVIIEENHTTDEIVPSKAAPNLTRFAQSYGYAWRFYAETHPGEPNYVAILGGNTFGIRDNDAFWCKPDSKDVACPHSADPGYVSHTVAAPSLATQLAQHGLSWKGYFEDIPSGGSRVARWPEQPSGGKPAALYASKHNGFMNFRDVQKDPALNQKIVGFDVLDRDLASGNVPNYAQIVPDQCDDMRGLPAGPNVPADCIYDAGDKLISRGDVVAGRLVAEIQRSRFWSRPDNSAIVITFDEGDPAHPGGHAAGCCGSSPTDPDNPGGGWIPTIVIANHGPRALTDLNPYNHYSLLRTTEDAFGISEHLGHAADTAHRVLDMTALFATPPAR
ncbi:MAG: alkaline phosphatase family protein [Rhizomicrobium sp.]